MMRRPSSMMQLYAWHRAALADPATPRTEGEIHCGWYRMRRVKNGPWIAARVFVERDIDPETGELTGDELLRMEIDGIVQSDPLRFWTHLRPITREEYERILDAPLRDSRMADQYQPIDLSLQPTLPEGA